MGMTTMDFKIKLLMAAGALVRAVVGFGVPAQATKARCTSVECACEHALKQNTVEALEEFLRKYPQETSKGQTACAALSVPSLDETSTLDSRGISEDGMTAQPEPSPYGG